MKLVLSIVLIMVLALGGGTAGFFLKPNEEIVELAEPAEPELLPEPEFTNLTREFVIPLVTDTRVRGHVVLTLGIHSETVPKDQLQRLEPIFRDRLLETLFRHASAGGFSGQFTNAANLNRLRSLLNNTASGVVHPAKATILITSIDRREL